MIDETRYAFGIDTERYSSDPSKGKWMDWEAVAVHKEPTVTFVCTRAGISWAYQDPLFAYNWQGIKDIDTHRLAHGIETYPVGRSAYHVLYPGESAVRQYDNFMRIVGDVADWEHDRLVIDLELDHGQHKRTITDCTKTFAYKCHAETGRYPILYGRTLWMNQYTYPQELTFMDLWLAQYRSGIAIPDLGIYIPEYAPPPTPLPQGFTSWRIHQTADKAKPIGSPVKKVMDYNRWNGGIAEVLKYFDYSDVVQPEPIPPLTLPLFSQNDSRWASDKLGTSSTTIGGYGCLVTAAAMICMFFGKDTDPKRLNQALIGVSGFESGNLLRYAAIEEIYPDIVLERASFISNPTSAQIDAVLESKIPVIVQVNLKPETSTLDEHWVVVIGKNNDGYIIADPIDGTIASLSRYAGKAYRMVVYNKVQEAGMYVIEMLGHLRMRTGPSEDYLQIGPGNLLKDPKGKFALRGETHESYKRAPDEGKLGGYWYKITAHDATGWIYGGKWTRITIVDTPPEPIPPMLTLEDKVDRLWDAHPELH